MPRRKSGLLAQVAIEGGQRLMDELVDVEAGELSSLAQRTTAASVHVHRDGHDGFAELARRRLAACLSVLADVAQNLGDNLRGSRGDAGNVRSHAAAELRFG